MKYYIKKFLSVILFLIFIELLMITFQASLKWSKIISFLQTPNLNLLINGILILCIYLAIFAITNKQVLSKVITFIMIFTISFAHFLKMKYLNIPFFFSDFIYISKFDLVISYLQLVDRILIIVYLIIIIALAIVSLKYDARKNNVSNFVLGRIFIMFILIVLISVGIQGQEKNNNFYYVMTLLNMARNEESTEKYYEQNGLLLSLLTVGGNDALKQVVYNEKTIEKLNKYYDDSYQEQSNEIVVYVLAESFYDPSRFKNVSLNKDPIPTIHKLMGEYTSGRIQLTKKDAFGTSLSEYEALTSFSNTFLGGNNDAYSKYLTEMKYHPLLGDLFDNKIAIHTYNAELYNRKRIYKDVYQFDKFIYDGAINDLRFKSKIEKNPYVSDQAGFNEVLAEIENIPRDESGFIFYLTMQNHSPYNKGYYKQLDFEVVTEENALSSYDKEQLQIYLQGLTYTDMAVKHFVKTIENIDRKITFVFFGDHKPLLSNQIFDGSEESKTDFFIYQNYQQKKLEYKNISTNYLAAVMLQLTNIPKSPFYKLLEQQVFLSPIIFEDKYLDLKTNTMQPVSKNEELEKLLYFYDVIHSEIFTTKDLLDSSFFKSESNIDMSKVN